MRKVIPVLVVAIALVGIVMWKVRHQGRVGGAGAGSGNAALAGLHGRGAARAVATPASLSGRVTRKADGAGIANAVVAISSSNMLVSMMSDDDETPPVVVVADATGAWTAPTIPPGSYLVTATAIGYVPAQSPKLWLAAGEQRGGVTIALEAGGTLVHGTVTDVGGGPINGVHVGVQRANSMDLSHARLFTMTRADGTYQLTLADGTYEVTTHHEDYTAGSHEVELAGKPVVVDFVLIPAGVIRGQVIARDTGKPVPNARLRCVAATRRRDDRADAEGKFVVRGLHSGLVAIEAVARGYASATPVTVEIGIGEQIDGIRVLVDRALSISGTVVKQGQHVGIAGVMIGAFSMSAGKQALAPDPSDEDGKFAIVGVRPGSYTVFAFGENAVPAIGKTVQVVDRDVTGVEIEMSAGVTLSGRVEPPQVATVGVTLAADVGLANMMEAIKTAMVHGESDATGAFVLHNVPAGALKLVARTSDGHAGSLPVIVAEVDQAGLVVNLEARASVSGRVVDTNNAPVAGVEVAANATDRHASMTINGPSRIGARSGPDGTFKLVGLEAGKYELETTGEAQRSASGGKQEPVEVELAPAAERTGVVVTIEARDGVIHGQVVGGDRSPAPDAWVTAKPDLPKASDPDPDFSDAYGVSSDPVLTGADGTFTISRLTRGTYTVIAEGPRGGSRAEKHGVKPGDSITIELAPLGTLTGHVVIGDAPVTQYEISCYGPAGSIDRDVAAADGAYSLEHLAPGSYSCKATSDAGTAAGKVDVPSGSAQLELAMAPWASLTGVVVSMFSGAPVPGIRAITNGGGSEVMAAIMGTGPTTDATGRFVIAHVSAGSGTLTLMDPSSMLGQLATRPYTAVQGQRVDLGTIKIVPPRNGDAGTLGMTVTATGTSLAVTAVKAGGPAEAAGVQVGDKIVSIDGHAVADLGVTESEQFLSSGQIGVGEVVQLGLDRGGATVQATITSIKW